LVEKALKLGAPDLGTSEVFETLMGCAQADAKWNPNRENAYPKLDVHFKDLIVYDRDELAGVSYWSVNAAAIREQVTVNNKDWTVNYYEPTTRAGLVNPQNLLKKVPHSTAKMHFCPDLNDCGLLPNGDLALCCMDFGLKHVIGNLREQTIDEIYKGPIFKKILQSFSDPSVDSLCRVCESSLHKESDTYARNHFLRVYKDDPEGLELVNAIR
jgi:hypothetical protein